MLINFLKNHFSDILVFKVNSENSKAKEEKTPVQPKEFDVSTLFTQVKTQGEKVRDLKSSKADKVLFKKIIFKLLI